LGSLTLQDQLGTFAIRVAGVSVTAGTAKTLIQYSASSTNTAEILFISLTQSGSTTSAMEQLSVYRKTGAATVTIGAVGTNIFDFTHNSTGGQSFLGTLSTSATGVSASSEGTNGDEIHRANFNVLAGYERDFQPNARIWVPVSGIVGLRCNAIQSLTWDALMVVREMRC
jgi:hypothetical protein